MIGYVAKDANNTLYLYSNKPEYDKFSEMWFAGPDMIDITGQFSEFDNMSYIDEPIKVEIKLERDKI